MYCPNCEKLFEGDGLCPQCGTQMEPEKDIYEKTETEEEIIMAQHEEKAAEEQNGEEPKVRLVEEDEEPGLLKKLPFKMIAIIFGAVAVVGTTAAFIIAKFKKGGKR